MLPQLFRVCIVKIPVDTVYATTERLVFYSLLSTCYCFFMSFFIFALLYLSYVIIHRCLFVFSKSWSFFDLSSHFSQVRLCIPLFFLTFLSLDLYFPSSSYLSHLLSLPPPHPSPLLRTRNQMSRYVSFNWLIRDQCYYWRLAC